MRKLGDKGFFGNKRGQNLTLGTIILIILGVAVLVFLIYGFSVGWGNLFGRLTEIGGGEVNVDTINQACVLACNTNSVDGYCTQKRTVNFGEEREITYVDEMNKEAENKSSLTGTCEFFAENVSVGLNIDECPTIDC